MNDTLLAIDIGSSNIKAVIAKNDLDYKINILGIGSEQSIGINKGLLTNIEEASKSIKSAISKARRSTSNSIDNTVVSISGAYTKGIRSSGSVNVPNGVIKENEINQVLQMALYNATIVPEYEIVHVIPISFKVDDSTEIENPLNMNGARLEASVYVITAKKTALTNLKSALKESGLEINNFVLNSYATALSVLDEQQKKFGAIVINIGSTTTEFSCYKGSSLIYNDFIAVGSNHITNDLSVMLHTPPGAAEALKLKYGSLLTNQANDELAIKKVKIPRIGDEQNSNEVGLETVQTIIHARIEEILILVKNSLKQSGIQERIGAGIVITGGMSELSGIKELASLVFDNIPIKISNPKNIKNGYMNFDDPTMATTVGLMLFSLDKNRNYELDSNKNLRKEIIIKQREPEAINQKTQFKNESKTKETEVSNNQNSELLPRISQDKKGKGMSSFWTKISELF